MSAASENCDHICVCEFVCHVTDHFLNVDDLVEITLVIELIDNYGLTVASVEAVACEEKEDEMVLAPVLLESVLDRDHGILILLLGGIVMVEDVLLVGFLSVLLLVNVLLLLKVFHVTLHLLLQDELLDKSRLSLLPLYFSLTFLERRAFLIDKLFTMYESRFHDVLL